MEKKKLVNGKALEEFCASLEERIALDRTHFGADDGIAPAPIGKPSDYHAYGNRGEGVYLLKTVYTDIKLDGEMDPAYTYGVHIRGDLYNDKSLYGGGDATYFDGYMIRGQDGRIYVYVDVTTREVTVNDYFFGGGGASYHADSLDFFYDADNGGSCHDSLTVVADPTGRYTRGVKPEGAVRLTDRGYAVEFAFDNHGKPFVSGDELGFGFYLNDAVDFDADTKSYKRVKIKNAGALNPHSMGYQNPSGDMHDALRISLKSATGRVELKEDRAEICGDVLTDIFKNHARVAVIYDRNATVQNIMQARRAVSIIRGSGGHADIFCENKMEVDAVYDCEILVGMTSRTESKSLSDELRIGEYGVDIYRDRIAVIGWSEKEAAAAGDLLCGILAHGAMGGSASELCECYHGCLGENLTDTPKLPALDSITDSGEDAYHMYRLSANESDYFGYLGLLEKAGFEKYTDNKIGSALFSTYVGMDRIVNVGYGGESERSLRVTVEPERYTALPSLDIPADSAVSDSPCSVTVTDWQHPGCMCLIYQLSNGHFVIVDSDCIGREAHIYEVLRRLSGNKKIVVESWLITHFHGDHLGGFIGYTGCDEYMRNTEIRSVIYNLPQEQVYSLAYFHDLENIALLNGERRSRLSESGTVFFKARTGQKFYFGNAEIEILWTYDDIMPFNVFVDRSNPTSIGFTVKLCGQKMMITGDSSGEEFTMAYKKYGQYLKSDFVQLSHHGQGDGYSPIEFYRAVGAPYVINPGIGDYYGVGEAWARDNCEKYLIRSDLGCFTVPLPYNGGAVLHPLK